jgi:hypothetical protein
MFILFGEIRLGLLKVQKLFARSLPKVPSCGGGEDFLFGLFL